MGRPSCCKADADAEVGTLPEPLQSSHNPFWLSPYPRHLIARKAMSLIKAIQLYTTVLHTARLVRVSVVQPEGSLWYD